MIIIKLPKTAFMLNEVTFLKQIRDKILLGEKKIPPDSNWGHQQATKRENTCQLSNFVNALEWACDLAIKLACSLPKSCLKPSNCEALQCCFDIAHSARWYKLVFNIYIYISFEQLTIWDQPNILIPSNIYQLLGMVEPFP